MHYIVDHSSPLATKILHPNFPLFLKLDRHTAQMNWQYHSYCLKSGMCVRSIPAHPPHFLQPLDGGVFSALQKGYSKEVDNYTRNIPDGIRKGNFWPVLKAAQEQAMTKNNILRGWSGTGIHPRKFYSTSNILILRSF